MVVAAAAAAAAVAEINMICSNHSRLLLQFHITGKCNLNCKHCYREEGNVEKLSYKDVISVIEQFKDLQKTYNTNHSIKKRAHINITGGEPFFRKDIKEILRYLGDNKEYFSYGILSNGSFIDDEIITILKETQVSFVQLSIDGNKKMHDYLRAKGDFDRVFKTAKHLEKNGIKTYISFTANKENFKYLPHVAKKCRRKRITKLWSDRLVPIGNGQELDSLVIKSEDFPTYVKTLKKAQGNLLTKILYPKTQVTMNRALQFQNSNGKIYFCSAADSLITVDEFGNIMPCRRLPIICGNVFDTTLKNVYYNNEVFLELRKDNVPKDCSACDFSAVCKGGAKCQSYAKYNNFHRADPACPLILK